MFRRSHGRLSWYSMGSIIRPYLSHCGSCRAQVIRLIISAEQCLMTPHMHASLAFEPATSFRFEPTQISGSEVTTQTIRESASSLRNHHFISPHASHLAQFPEISAPSVHPDLTPRVPESQFPAPDAPREHPEGHPHVSESEAERRFRLG